MREQSEVWMRPVWDWPKITQYVFKPGKVIKAGSPRFQSNSLATGLLSPPTQFGRVSGNIVFFSDDIIKNGIEPKCHFLSPMSSPDNYLPLSFSPRQLRQKGSYNRASIGLGWHSGIGESWKYCSQGLVTFSLGHIGITDTQKTLLRWAVFTDRKSMLQLSHIHLFG